MKASSRGLGNIFHLLDFQGHPTMRTKATTLEVRQHAEKNNNHNNRIKVTDSHHFGLSMSLPFAYWLAI